jgi:U3 small nucleolar RNA-associated protein 7
LERLDLEGKADGEGAAAGGASDDDGSDAESANGDPARRKREAKKKHKMRGKGTAMKRFLSKKKKNVIDPSLVSL